MRSILFVILVVGIVVVVVAFFAKCVSSSVHVKHVMAALADDNLC